MTCLACGAPPRFIALVVLLSLAVAACSAGGDGGLDPGPAAAGARLAVGGRHACQSDSTGTHCWGRGAEGQLGSGGAVPVALPVEVAAAPEFTAISAGRTHTCALVADGAAWCWGDDRDGQLGVGAASAETCGSYPCATAPVRVTGNLRFSAIAAGARATCALRRDDGTAWCWGSNDLGQLGVTSDTARCATGRCSRSPVPVDGARAYVAISAGNGHACAIERAGGAWCWGYLPGSSDGTHTISFFDPAVEAVSGGLRFSRIAAGGFHTCALSAAGAAWCWGIDAMGAGPSLLESPVPVAVAGGHAFREIVSGGVSACALDQEQVAWCWGPNSYGQIGVEPVGSSVRYDEPVRVSGGLRFAALSVGTSSACGVTTDDRTVCWGRGDSGELGSGGEDRSAPTGVPGLARGAAATGSSLPISGR